MQTAILDVQWLTDGASKVRGEIEVGSDKRGVVGRGGVGQSHAFHDVVTFSV